MMLDALRYASMGWRVFPCHPRKKEPLGLLVPHGCLDATTDSTKIREWWGAYPDANIGIAAGKESQLTVIDLDGQAGQKAKESMGLLSSVVSLTGNGQQLFYAYDGALKNSVKNLADGLDVRNDGGYVVAPPSIHPNGKRYTWLVGPTLNLPSFPSVLVNLAKQKDSSRVSTVPIGWESELLNNLTEGNRNDSFARLVGKLHHKGFDKTTIWAFLLPYARKVNFSDKELNAIIQSISKYPTEGTRSTDESSDIEHFLADAKPTEWFVDQIIAERAIGFIAGLPETSKTWAGADLLIECARGGGLWLGLFQVKGGRALFIEQERDAAETKNRFKRLLEAKGISVHDIKDNLHVKTGTNYKVDVDESFSSLRQYLASIRPTLLVLDPFSEFYTTDDNNRMEMGRVMARFKELRTEFGCTIVLIDHEGKGAFQDMKDGEVPSYHRQTGSIAKPAGAEFVLTVRRTDPTTCMFHHTKATQGSRSPSFTVHVADTLDKKGIRVYGEQGKA